MSTVPVMDDSRREETPLLGSVSTFLELVPAAIYVCDAEGVIQQYNSKAAELWGRAPEAGDTCERYCGSKALYDGNGTPMPHAQTPMAEAIRTGQSFRNIEAQVERPAGDRVWVLVNIDPIRDETGRIIGAINCFSDITLRKLAEERLQESDALLHGIVDTSPDCIRVIRPDGTVAWINPAGLKMIDAKSPEALEDVDLADMVAPEHRALWRENHRRVCNGESLSWEFDAISFTGKRRHVETHATPLRLPDGTVAHLGVTRDVTARKQSEAALRDIERRSEDILQALPVAIYTTDAEGRVSSCNQAAIDLAGRKPRIGIDQWCITLALFRPDGRPLPHEQSPLAKALREREPHCGEEVIAERPDGTRVPLLAYPTPLFNADGELIGAVNMLVDISERKQAEQSALRLAAIVASSDDAVISKDTNGIIQSWNAGARRLFGYEEHEVIGRPINILIPPDRPDEEPAILRRIRAGERIEHYETVRMRKDGSMVDISLTVSPLRNAQGEIIGASKIARDITQQKQHERRQQLLINELNHRVKNTLATVQSIAGQTFRDTTATPAVKWFEGRLIAISRSHDVLTRENWEGADLMDIATVALAPAISGIEDRVRLHGPKARLTPRAALSLSLALHELCTNALKYGALSSRKGQVRLEWSLTDSDLHITWAEAGGPPVSPPERKGFGSRLLEQALSYELGADVDLSFPAAGLTCTIRLPAQAAMS